MAQLSVDQLAKSLLDPARREVAWPMVFAGVKNIVRTNNLNAETLSCIKAWLRSNDSQLHTPLLSLTVMHTMSLNCSQSVRNQLAAPKLFQRLEKQLAKPQGPQVATAIVQVLVDWAHLFGHEELGARSRAVLAQPRYSQMAVGSAPSAAVGSMEEEMRLGMPPVAPIRGEDFIRWMYRGASLDGSSRGAAAAAGGGASQGGSSASGLAGGGQQQQQGYIPGGAPPPITSQEAPQLCKRMRSDAERLSAALSACRGSAGRSQRVEGLLGPMDAAYREAERCSQWRRRVQDFAARHSDDPAALSSLLAATDVINQALQRWQDFTGQEVFAAMRITVPPMPPDHLQQQQPQRPPQQQHGLLIDVGGPAPAAPAQQQQPFDLLSSTQPQIPQQAAVMGAAAGAAGASSFPAPSSNPFATTSAPATSATARPAQPSPPHQHQPQPSFSDWDPFAAVVAPTHPQQHPQQHPPQRQLSSPLPQQPPQPQSHPQPQQLTTVAAAPSPGWTSFHEDSSASAAAAAPVTTAPSRSHSPVPYSPSQSSPQISGMLPSPVGTAATANSSASASAASTPNGPVASAAAAAAAAARLTSPVHVAATTPQHPSTTFQTPASVPTAAGAGTAAGFPPAASSASATSHMPTPPSGPMSAARPLPVLPASTSPNHLQPLNGSSPPPVPTATTSTSALDWLPLFERLATELQTLATAAAGPPPPTFSDAAAAAASGPPLAAVLPSVRQLCEALAEQHAAKVAELTSAHAAELRDVRMQAALVANVRQVAAASSSSGSAAATGSAAAAAGSGTAMGRPGGQGGGLGSARPGGMGSAMVAGVGANGYASMPQQQQLGPLHQGLHHQQQLQQYQGTAQQLSNGMSALSLGAGGRDGATGSSSSGGRPTGPLDFSLI